MIIPATGCSTAWFLCIRVTQGWGNVHSRVCVHYLQCSCLRLYNRYVTRPYAYQHRFSINVWAGMVNNYVFGPYIVPPSLGHTTYLIFIIQAYSLTHGRYPTVIRRQIRFQYDRKPPHFGNEVRHCMYATYPLQSIVHGEPVPWPPWLIYLSGMVFFSVGLLEKHNLWASQFRSRSYDHLYDAGDVQCMAGNYANVRQFAQQQCESFIIVCGSSFEHFMWYVEHTT